MCCVCRHEVTTARLLIAMNSWLLVLIMSTSVMQGTKESRSHTQLRCLQAWDPPNKHLSFDISSPSSAKHVDFSPLNLCPSKSLSIVLISGASPLV